MGNHTRTVRLGDILASPQSNWIVDVAVLRCAGEQHHCALVQDLKTLRVLGWSTALDADPMLMLRAVQVACEGHVRTRPTNLYLYSGCESSAPQLISALVCQQFQLRFMAGQELFLLNRLERVWRVLQIRFATARAIPDIDDDWFE